METFEYTDFAFQLVRPSRGSDDGSDSVLNC